MTNTRPDDAMSGALGMSPYNNSFLAVALFLALDMNRSAAPIDGIGLLFPRYSY